MLTIFSLIGLGFGGVSASWGTAHEIVLPLLDRGSFIQLPTLSGNITTHDIFKFALNDQLLDTESAHIRVKRRSRRSRHHRAHRRHNHRRNRITTTTAANCLNEARNCLNLMGHCMGSGAVHMTVTQYCTLNCGLCSPTPDKCKDFSHNCGQWKHQGFCKANNPNFSEQEQRMFCARTCGKCARQPKPDKKKDNGKTKPQPITPTPKPPPPPAVQKPQPVKLPDKPNATTTPAPDNGDCKSDPEEL